MFRNILTQVYARVYKIIKESFEEPFKIIGKLLGSKVAKCKAQSQKLKSIPTTLMRAKIMDERFLPRLHVLL